MKCRREVNYCGFGKSYFIRPPYWALLNASCLKHDSAYSMGGTKEDRIKADIGFLWRMLEDINKLEDYNRKRKAVRIAILYYILVRMFGWISFNKKSVL